MNQKIELNQMPQAVDAATAEQFLRWCCHVVGYAFHPDTPFREYMEAGGGRTFTDEEAVLLDAQMKAVFQFIPDPYAVGLEEFAAMRTGPVMPSEEAGQVENTTTPVKVVLARRTDIRDPILSAFTAAQLQLHLREARAMPGLAVVQVPAEEDLHIDTVAVSGGHDHVIAWFRKLVEMEAARSRYDIELPPDSARENDTESWAEWLADRLDEPGVIFSCTICLSEEEWRLGLPAPTAD